MRYKYYFFDFLQPNLQNWLDGHKIPYKITGGGVVPQCICFSLYSNGNNYKVLLEELSMMGVKRPIISAEYTKKELSGANFLTITPKLHYINIINCRDAYNYSCTWINDAGIKKIGHEEQCGIFKIEKEPLSNTNTAFWLPDSGFSEIFCDCRVVNLAMENNLRGIQFRNVLLSQGSFSERIFQMSSNNYLGRESIDFGHGEIMRKCQLCGKEQFYVDGAYQLHIFTHALAMKSDLYVSERLFGEGIPYPIFLISQRFYQLLKEKHLDGSIRFSPVVEIL